MPFLFTCPHCGARTNVPDEFAGRTGPCAHCGNTITIPQLVGGAPYRIEDSAAMRMLIPVGRSGLAIAAGYVGLLALLCFPAPIALVLGILAVRDIRKHPEKHGMGRAIFGLVMGAVFTTLLIVSLVAGLLGSAAG